MTPCETTEYKGCSIIRRVKIETPETKKRARHVFDTGEIPHLWAHQIQADARNKQGNLFFEGPTIYSYRHSWPLARIYTKRGKPPLVLTNSDKYGSTTSGHQSSVNAAATHLTQIACPYPDMNNQYASWSIEKHQANLKFFEKEIADAFDKAGRRLQFSYAQNDANYANEMHAANVTYRKFFGIRRLAPAMPNFQPALDRARAIESPDPVRDAKRFKAQQARKALREKQDAQHRAAWETEHTDDVKKWRAGELNYLPSYRLPGKRGWYGGSSGSPVYLRIQPINPSDVDRETMIQTSLGATIPASHAPRLWKFIRLVMQRGVPYNHNGHTEHAGDFRIDKVEVDGTVYAGCHVIKFDEIQKLAETLGLSSYGTVQP
jgi:hypothetical protein